MTVVGSADATYPTVITKMNLPFMFARRAMINTYYAKYDAPSNTVTTVNSSLLNEQLLEEAQTERADVSKRMGRTLINDEVIAFNHINYV